MADVKVTSPSSPHDLLRQRIAGWAKVPDQNHVFLTPSGMSAIYAALRSARRYRFETNGLDHNPRVGGTGSGGGTSIVYGFPYLDTLKLCSRSEFCPDGVEFFGFGNQADLRELEKLLQRSQSTQPSGPNHQKRKYCALFTEVPSNPLLQCPDLYKLRELAEEYDFLLVVDDTISNFLNVNILESGLADAVCSSLTKLVSGRGDAMAGSVVVNPATKGGRWMQQDLFQNCNPVGGLYEADSRAILLNSTDFEQRNAVINANAEGLADWLNQHPDVQTVYYPKLSESAALYQQVKSVGGGYGGLMSIILHPHMCQRTFYDALNVAKGPSLGTDFTLVCPYTLLAHYHELDFAMTYNVPPNLMRIAVGLEPLETLQDKFEQAFQSSRLYPKPRKTATVAETQKRNYSTYPSAEASSAAAFASQAMNRQRLSLNSGPLLRTFHRLARFAR